MIFLDFLDFSTHQLNIFPSAQLVAKLTYLPASQGQVWGAGDGTGSEVVGLGRLAGGEFAWRYEVQVRQTALRR